MSSRITKSLAVIAFTSALAACSSVPLDQSGSAGGAGSGSASTGQIMDPFNPQSPLAQQRSVYFDFDSYTIADQYRSVVEMHANYLRSNPQRMVRVEGNADARGGAEYNLALFKGGKYKEAIASFEDFLTAYPGSTLAPEARFYQGSARYATKDFKGSITGLQSMVQQSPDHARAPDALLVIAASQTEINNIPGAKTTLERIVKTYPKSNAAETAKSRLKLLQ